MDAEMFEDLPQNLSFNQSDDYNQYSTEIYDDGEAEDALIRWSMKFLYVIAVLSIASSIFVSFVIAKYQKLRKEVTNRLLLHANIVEVLFLFSTTISTGIFTQLDIDITSTVACTTYEVATALILCVFLLLILLTIDWYIETYHENRHATFRRIYNFVVAAIYVVTIVVACLTSDYCTYSSNFYGFTLQIVLAFSGVMLIFVIVMNVIHRIKLMRTTDKASENIGLAITNIFMLAWTTVYIPVLIAIFADEPDLLMVLIIVAVSTCLAIPIFNWIYLYRRDNYKVFFERAFRCQCSDDRNEPVANLSVAYDGTMSGPISEPRQTHVA